VRELPRRKVPLLSEIQDNLFCSQAKANICCINAGGTSLTPAPLPEGEGFLVPEGEGFLMPDGSLSGRYSRTFFFLDILPIPYPQLFHLNPGLLPRQFPVQIRQEPDR
jgi:hypothetical protein